MPCESMPHRLVCTRLSATRRASASGTSSACRQRIAQSVSGSAWTCIVGLHHRAELPRHELVLAVAVQLALGLAARRRREHVLEDALADLLDAFGAVDDRAAVEVDVVFLLQPPRGFGRR